MTDDSDRPGRDYDASRLARFEDGPADDVAADLAKLMGRKAGAGAASPVKLGTKEHEPTPVPTNPAGEWSTTDPATAQDSPSRKPSLAPSSKPGSRPIAVASDLTDTPPIKGTSRRPRTRPSQPPVVERRPLASRLTDVRTTPVTDRLKTSGTSTTGQAPSSAPPEPAQRQRPQQQPATGDATARTGRGSRPRRGSGAAGGADAPAARRRRGTGAEGDPGEVVSRIVYLPVRMVEDLRVYRATRPGTSNTQIALSALNAHHLDIDALLDAERGARVTPGPLFDEVLTAPQVPKRQLEITPTRAQLKIIDSLVTNSKAKDRSQMLGVVISKWLTDQNSPERG